MAAVSIKELIERKESIDAKKKELYDIETSIGTIVVKQPTAALVADARALDENSDPYLIVESTVEPNLKDRELLQAFGCRDALDLPAALFKPGEVLAISRKIMECAGYAVNIESRVHRELKN